jgi:HlyD family secretion protein
MSKLNMGKLNIRKLKVPPIKMWTFDQLKFAAAEALDQLKSAAAGPKDGSSLSSIHSNLKAGLIVVLLLGGGVGGWAATTQLSGALIAQGSVVVDSNVKKVQHPTGGIVGELLVHDGDHVTAGDVLVRLDETVLRANLAIVTKGLNDLAARKARLEAERDSAESITFPPDLLARTSDPDAMSAVAGAQNLFQLRRKARSIFMISIRPCPASWRSRY